MGTKANEKSNSGSKKKSNGNTKRPTAAMVSQAVGVSFVKPLTAQAIRSMIKALPGYAAQLDDAAVLLGDGRADGDARVLGIKDVSSKRLLQLKQQRAELLAAEVALYDAYRSVYHQRLKIDDEAMRGLFKITRRVDALSE